MWLVGACVIGMSAMAQVPGIMNYQGRLTVSGTNYTGPVRFKFALVDGVVGTSYWSNNGSSVNGSEPSADTGVNAQDGQFQVLLGDVSMPNMQTIPSPAFDHSDVRLRIWMNVSDPTFTQLAPDQRVAAAGYAFRAAGLPDGTVTGPMLAPNAVGAGELANGSVGTAKIADNAITANKLAANAVGSVQLSDTLRLQDLVIESAGGLNRVEVGSAGDAGILRMNHGSIGRFLEITGTTDGGFFRLYDQLGGLGAGQKTVELGSSDVGGYATVLQHNGGAGLQLNGQNGNTPGGNILLYRSAGIGASLSGQGTGGGGQVSLRNAAGQETVALVGAETGGNAGGQLTVRRSDGAATLILDAQLGSGGGQISVRNAAGDETVEILGNETADNQGGQVTVKRDDGKAGIILDGQLGSGGGEIRVANAAGQTTVQLQGTEGANEGDGAGQLVLRQLDGQVGLLADAQAGGQGGQLVVNNMAGQTRVNIVGQQSSGGGYVGVRDASGTVTAQISGAEIASQGAQILLAKANGTPTVLLDAELGAGGGSLRLAKADGSFPIRLDASASGGGKVTTQVLEITGGSDLSEQFEVQHAGPAPVPGMVLCIDPDHEGGLLLSTKAFDPTVVGVISGAGGIRTGMLMGQQGSVADGRFPVALAGRVYCLVDASCGAVKPGDLLTTSYTPGHAMRAGRSPEAFGAILGKALTPLPEGRGLVLVLVSLQ